MRLLAVFVRHRAKLIVAFVFAVMAVVLSACGGGRPDFGSGPIPCYQTLPVAKHALSEPRPFVGVKLVSSSSANKQFDMGIEQSVKHVCIVAFKNSHSTSSGSNHRTFTLVAVSLDTKAILATKVVKTLPSTFRHTLSLS